MRLIQGLVLAAGFAACPVLGDPPPEVATVVGLVGTSEVRSSPDAQWQRVSPGTVIRLRDTIRTAGGSTAKLVFRDDSVVDLGESTEVVVERLNFDFNERRYLSSLRMTQGRVHSLIAESYQSPRSRYEVETPTAVADTQGDELVVSYDPRLQNTDVAALEGSAEVQATIGLIGSGVTLAAGEATRTGKGRLPSPPRRLSDDEMSGLRGDLEVVRVHIGHPAMQARVLQPGDVPGLLKGAPERESGVTPGHSLSKRLSPDARATTQPTGAYRSSGGGVHVTLPR